MKSIKISVIVPVYNVERYLDQSINSVLDQSFRDFELILVNDGSTDSSLEICLKYQKKDNRIVVIDKSNEGLEMTRFVGVSNASGDYITHLDSDDWFCKNALNKMYEAAIKSDADIVVGSFIRVMDKFGVIKKKGLNLIKEEIVLGNELFMNQYYKNFFGINLFSVTVWAKLYKKSFIDNIDIKIEVFKNLGEDLRYNIQVFPEAKKIHFINEPLVYYRFGGMTSKLNESILDDAIGMYNMKKEMILKYNLLELTKYIVIEMKNYLATYIKMLLEFRGYDKKLIFNTVNDIIMRIEYIEVAELINNDAYLKDDFVQAFVHKDIDKMIAIQKVEYDKVKFKRKLLKVASKILKF